jgi:hypothetical protein
MDFTEGFRKLPILPDNGKPVFIYQKIFQKNACPLPGSPPAKT